MSQTTDEPSAADVLRALRSKGGKDCERQTRVFLALWQAREADPRLEKLNQAELARDLGMPRQAVNHAIRALRRKGFVQFGTERSVAVREVVKVRRVIDLVLPLPDQMQLPFPRLEPPSRRSAPARAIGAAA